MIVSAGLAFVASIAMLFAFRALVAAPREAVLDRAKRVTRATIGSTAAAAATQASKGGFWTALLSPLSGIARPRQAEEMSRIRKSLSHAGFRGEHVVDVFFGSKIALGLTLGGGLLFLNAARAAPLPNARLLAVVLVAIGFYAPNVWLRGRVHKRQTAISHGLADTLDLVVTCVEAGLGLDAALTRIGGEIAASAPVLASELRLTTGEINAGMSRAEAFRRLADRTGVEDLRSLATIVIQTEMFGTSVGHALRVHSSGMRTRRTHTAEERGATASVKMMIPLIFCILPSLLVVIMGPAAVRIVRLLVPALAGP